MNVSIENLGFNAIPIDEQILNLKSLGLIIDNVTTAKSFLSRVSYYRLIKAYGSDFKGHDGRFLPNTHFDQITDLYNLNDQLRSLLLPYLERIELSLRCQLTNLIAVKYGPFAYEDSSTFKDIDSYYKTKEHIDRNIATSQNSQIVKHFNENHMGKIPLHALVEVLSFGTLANYYNALKKEDAQEIADYFRVKEYYLKSWFLSFAALRNMCAHYDRIYGKIITKPPKLYKEDRYATNGTLFSVLLCMKRIVHDANEWNTFVITLSQYMNIHKDHVNPLQLGLVDGWSDKLYIYDINEQFASLIKRIIMEDKLENLL